jgi:hypothetical protein
VFSPDGSRPPEIVSAKMNGRQVNPGKDLGHLNDFYNLNISDGVSALSHDLQTNFDSPAYRNAESVVVKYTDVATGEIREIPLSDFREKLPKPIDPETGKYNTKILGLAPDNTHPKSGIEHIKLGIDQQPLLQKVINNIDENL